jgi:hypothetical protein
MGEELAGRWYAKSITNRARAYQAGLAHFMPFNYTVLVLVVIGAALIWGATLDSQGRIEGEGARPVTSRGGAYPQ